MVVCKSEFIWFSLISSQALDNDFSDNNRRMCAEAAKPLIQAVDELTTYASSPEFASVPAKISMKVRYWLFEPFTLLCLIFLC